VRSASQLALEIYARMPLIPRSLFLNGVNIEIGDKSSVGHGRGTLTNGRHKIKATFRHCGSGISFTCQRALVWGTLTHENIMPLLGIYETMANGREKELYFIAPYMEHGTLREWRQKVNPSGVIVRDCMLEVARAVQHVHSLGFVFRWFDAREIFIDSNFHAKILGQCISAQYISDTPSRYLPFSHELQTYEYDVFRFGCVYYEMHFGVEIMEGKGEPECRKIVVKRLTQPKIHEDVWSLIQRCCAEDAKGRPTMDAIVEEMESWSFFLIVSPPT
jgi:serine/threonine protein kinase